MEMQAPYTPDDNDYNPIDSIHYSLALFDNLVEEIERATRDTDGTTYVAAYAAFNAMKKAIENNMENMKEKVIGYVSVSVEPINVLGYSVSYSSRSNYKFEDNFVYADYIRETKIEKAKMEAGIKMATQRGQRIVTNDGEYYDPVEMTTTVFPTVKELK